jgi:large subunit ribosomal protein L7/L12
MQQTLWPTKIVQIGDLIGHLTLAEAAQLRDHLEQVYGIVARTTLVDMPVVPDVVIEPAVVAATQFDVVLEGVAPEHRIAAIRQVREALAVSLKEARDLVEGAPRAIKERLEKAEAEELKKRVEAAGAKVALRPCAA